MSHPREARAMQRADTAAVRWLTARGKPLHEAQWLVLRSRVIDCWPMLPDDEVDSEVARCMAAEEGDSSG